MPRTFGGQLVGQALVAASRTVAPQFVARGLLKTRTRPTLNRRIESAHLCEHSP